VDHSDEVLESNTARLIQSGMGGEARLDSDLREALHRRLISELHAGLALPAFPEKALGLLTALGLLAVLSTLVQFSQAGMRAFENGFWPMLILLLLLNLMLIPVASIVIVLQRRSHDRKS
jgi:hypothetical protein